MSVFEVAGLDLTAARQNFLFTHVDSDLVANDVVSQRRLVVTGSHWIWVFFHRSPVDIVFVDRVHSLMSEDPRLLFVLDGVTAALEVSRRQDARIREHLLLLMTCRHEFVLGNRDSLLLWPD
jgi:hypothetical protein